VSFFYTLPRTDGTHSLQIITTAHISASAANKEGVPTTSAAPVTDINDGDEANDVQTARSNV